MDKEELQLLLDTNKTLECNSKNLRDLTKENIDELAELRLSKMSDEEIKNSAKNFRKNLLIYQIFCLILATVSIIFISISFVLSIYQLTAIFGIMFIISLTSFIVLRCKKPNLKNKDKDCVFYILVKEITKTRNEFIELEEKLDSLDKQLNFLNGKRIKSASIIDTYTEYTDKLHAILNYQEIIQHRMYKFLVYFEDSTSQVFTAEQGTNLYNKLIKHIRVNDSQETLTTKTKKDSISQIREYKKLLDDGIITEEEFQNKKNELLKKDG